MDKRYVIQREGKDYALYGGLLDLAHERGLLSIETTLVQLPTEANGNCAVVQATVRLSDGAGIVRTFQGLGDASPANVNRMMAPHLLRMAECAPVRAEILTRDGWMGWSQLKIGESVLAYDVDADRCRWVPLQGVTTYLDGRPVVRLRGRSFNATVTPEHTWAVHLSGERVHAQTRRLRKTCELKAGDGIIVAAPAEEGKAAITPREAAVLGWLATDGCIRQHMVAGRWGPYVRAQIDQSKPEYVAELRELLGDAATETVEHKPPRTFPGGKTYDVRPAHRFTFHAKALRDLANTYAASGHKLGHWAGLSALVIQLSQPARAAMLDAMLKADGTRKGKTWVFGKRDHAGVMEAFEVLATLEGYAIGKQGMSSTGNVPLRTLRRNRLVSVPYLRVEDSEPEPVWCPTTPLGTWVMRLDGCITITGNTRAKARALRDAVNVGEALADDPSDEAPEPSAAPRTEARQAPGTHQSRPGKDATAREWFTYLSALARDHGIAVPPTPGPGVTDEAVTAENKRLKELLQEAAKERSQ